MKSVTRWLIPEIVPQWRPFLLASALVGAAIAGVYGIVHDQITFTISPEYFTKFKFVQFAWADPGLKNPRWSVGLIGFLATWWVGGIAGWALARLGIMWLRKEPEFEKRMAVLAVAKQFWVILAVAMIAGFSGSFASISSQRIEWLKSSGIDDPQAFATVGLIHNFGYLGALVGLIIAAIFLRRRFRSDSVGSFDE